MWPVCCVHFAVILIATAFGFVRIELRTRESWRSDAQSGGPVRKDHRSLIYVSCPYINVYIRATGPDMYINSYKIFLNQTVLLRWILRASRIAGRAVGTRIRPSRARGLDSRDSLRVRLRFAPPPTWLRLCSMLCLVPGDHLA